MTSTHPDIRRISRVELSSEELAGSSPFVVTGGVAEWPAAARWTPDTLGGLAAKRPVDIAVSFSGSFRSDPEGAPVDAKNQLRINKIPFQQAVREILANEGSSAKYYITQQSLKRTLPELLPDVICYWPSENAEINLWFGSSGVISPLHFDVGPNVLSQIYGTKRITMFAPEDSGRLYPYPPESKMSHLSYVDVEAPDAAKYPQFLFAQPLSFTIDSGDLLFIPPFWWHHVESLSVSISVNQWDAVPRLTQCRGPMGLRWCRTEYVRDRRVNFRELAGLGRRDLITAAQELIHTNLPVAVLSAGVVMEDPELNTHDCAPDPEMKRQFASILSVVVEGKDSERDSDSSFDPAVVAAVSAVIDHLKDC